MKEQKHYITFRLAKERKELLIEEARRQSQSLSKIVEDVINEFITEVQGRLALKHTEPSSDTLGATEPEVTL